MSADSPEVATMASEQDRLTGLPLDSVPQVPPVVGVSGESAPRPTDATPVQVQIPPGPPPTDELPPIPDWVGFDDLVSVYLDADPRIVEGYRKRFAESQGTIRRAFYCWFTRGAVILTVKTETGKNEAVELFYWPPIELNAAQPAQVLFLVDQIAIEAKRLVAGRPRTIAFEAIYSAIVYLFKLVDAQLSLVKRKRERPAQVPISPAQYSVVTNQLIAVRDYVRRTATRRAVLLYAGMMFYVSAAIGLGLGYFTVTSGLVPRIPADPVLFVSSLIAGGLGAIFSVMIRMSQGKLTLSSDFAVGETMLVGSFRPLIGVISGAIVYVVLNSGLIRLQVQTQAQAWYFYSAVSFVAGFSERVVRDVLVRAQTQLNTAQHSDAEDESSAS